MNTNDIIGQYTCPDCGQTMSLTASNVQEHSLFCLNKKGADLKDIIEKMAEKATFENKITFYDGFWKKGYKEGFKEADAIGFAIWLSQSDFVQMNPDIDKWVHFSPDNKKRHTTQELYVKFLNTK